MFRLILSCIFLVTIYGNVIYRDEYGNVVRYTANADELNVYERRSGERFDSGRPRYNDHNRRLENFHREDPFRRNDRYMSREALRYPAFETYNDASRKSYLSETKKDLSKPLKTVKDNTELASIEKKAEQLDAAKNVEAKKDEKLPVKKDEKLQVKKDTTVKTASDALVKQDPKMRPKDSKVELLFGDPKERTMKKDNKPKIIDASPKEDSSNHPSFVKKDSKIEKYSKLFKDVEKYSEKDTLNRRLYQDSRRPYARRYDTYVSRDPYGNRPYEDYYPRYKVSHADYFRRSKDDYLRNVIQSKDIPKEEKVQDLPKVATKLDSKAAKQPAKEDELPAKKTEKKDTIVPETKYENLFKDMEEDATPEMKDTPVKKEAPTKKDTPVKKETPTKKEAPVKKEAPAKKETLVKKEAPTNKETTVKKDNKIVYVKPESFDKDAHYRKDAYPKDPYARRINNDLYINSDYRPPSGDEKRHPFQKDVMQYDHIRGDAQRKAFHKDFIPVDHRRHLSYDEYIRMRQDSFARKYDTPRRLMSSKNYGPDKDAPRRAFPSRNYGPEKDTPRGAMPSRNYGPDKDAPRRAFPSRNYGPEKDTPRGAMPSRNYARLEDTPRRRAMPLRRDYQPGDYSNSIYH